MLDTKKYLSGIRISIPILRKINMLLQFSAQMILLE